MKTLFALLLTVTLVQGQINQERSLDGTHVKWYSYHKEYPMFTIVITRDKVVKAFEISPIIHDNRIGGDSFNVPVKVTVPTQSKIKYNFSHSILTKGKPYEQVVKENGGVLDLPFIPYTTDIEFLDRSNIFISSTSGLFLFNVDAMEITLVWESEYKNKEVDFFGRTIIVNGNNITMEYVEKLSKEEMENFYSANPPIKLTKIKRNFLYDRKRNTLIEVIR